MPFLKEILFFLFIMNVSFGVKAVDLGVHGKTFQLKEPNLLDQIHQKLLLLEENGTLKNHQEQMIRNAQKRMRRPQKVEGIFPAKEQRVYAYDPTFVLQRDIFDHKGRMIHPKGTKINPLLLKPYNKEILFIDGDDPDQKELAFKKIEKNGLRPRKDRGSLKETLIVLTRGSPLNLLEEFKERLILLQKDPSQGKNPSQGEGLKEETLSLPIYFDQGGVLTKKLGILHVPALLSQKAFVLQLEENTPEAFLAREVLTREVLTQEFLTPRGLTRRVLKGEKNK